MTERTAGSLSQSDTYMGRIVVAEGRLHSTIGVGERVLITLDVPRGAVVQVAGPSK